MANEIRAPIADMKKSTSMTEETERTQQVGGDKLGQTAATAVAIRRRAPGKPVEYETTVRGCFMSLSAENAKLFARNLQRAAELAWEMEDEMRREDEAAVKAIAGLDRVLGA